MARLLTAGESHGKALIGILEGYPSGISIVKRYIQNQLQRRKLGYGRGDRQRIEDDQVEVLSGVRQGKTIGSPIAMLIWNRDWENWKTIMRAESDNTDITPVLVPRPGHADYVGAIKYNHHDIRNVIERASARETAIRVALGSLARKLLEDLDVNIASRVVRVGGQEDHAKVCVPIGELNGFVDSRQLRCVSEEADAKMVQEVDCARAKGDTLGGIFETYASGVPVGLGSYVHWDRKINSAIARSFMGLNAIKGVEIGLGFETSSKFGSKAHDEYFPTNKKNLCRLSNMSGGIEGGMTTGETLVVRAAMKPLATLENPLSSVNISTGRQIKASVERSDVCAVPAAAVISESLLALVLAEHVIEKFGGDSLGELKDRVISWRETTDG